MMMEVPADGAPTHNTEAYARIVENPFLEVSQNPLSTFSIDVDTASYSNVRRFLADGQLPPADAVRIEELVNYFTYDYPAPKGPEPFSVDAEVAGCPWNDGHRLVRIGLQGRRIDAGQLPERNLVFLLDVSGSMGDPRKLPLLKASMKLLVEQLTARDRVAMVVYAGASGVALPPTAGDHKDTILAALARLEAGGSTNGAGGIQQAYQLARQNFHPGGINRVILATDGDFNVGITSEGALTRLIEKERESGVFLTVLGLGTGNVKDSTMEKLADAGNGNYAYLDTLSEARKVLVTQAGSTLVTIAKDVKIQIEFNPARVQAYRLIGYENRLLSAEDFNDDKKDAGEIGAGHNVTALYEIVPVGAPSPTAGVDPLRYQTPRAATPQAGGDELLTVKLRYKEPREDHSRLIAGAVQDAGGSLGQASADTRFSAAVAAFGMLLRGSEHKGSASFAQVRELARQSLGQDPNGYRAEFLTLVDKAEALASR
jgi:Ca-activated chloride channel family protein